MIPGERGRCSAAPLLRRGGDAGIADGPVEAGAHCGVRPADKEAERSGEIRRPLFYRSRILL
jgi:hypothetical protein